MSDFADRARRLEWLLLDVDGVLTDGLLYFGPEGTTKAFHVRDGLGLKRAQNAGLKVGLLTGRADAATQRRADELGLDEVVSGAADKNRAFDDFLRRHAVAAERVAYAGDDLPDLPVLDRAGLSFAPADADPEVRRRATITLAAAGGRGAVRELVDRLLEARGDLEVEARTGAEEAG